MGQRDQFRLGNQIEKLDIPQAKLGGALLQAGPCRPITHQANRDAAAVGMLPQMGGRVHDGVHGVSRTEPRETGNHQRRGLVAAVMAGRYWRRWGRIGIQLGVDAIWNVGRARGRHAVQGCVLGNARQHAYHAIGVSKGASFE